MEISLVGTRSVRKCFKHRKTKISGSCGESCGSDYKEISVQRKQEGLEN